MVVTLPHARREPPRRIDEGKCTALHPCAEGGTMRPEMEIVTLLVTMMIMTMVMLVMTMILITTKNGNDNDSHNYDDDP